jgi:hypothetical protein
MRRRVMMNNASRGMANRVVRRGIVVAMSAMRGSVFGPGGGALRMPCVMPALRGGTEFRTRRRTNDMRAMRTCLQRRTDLSPRDGRHRMASVRMLLASKRICDFLTGNRALLVTAVRVMTTM